MSTLAATGKLIVIDGIGGTGKSLQVEKIADSLRNQGHTCDVWSFPRYDVQPMGPKIRNYQEGHYGDPSTLSPYLASELYSIDRMQAVAKLRERLEKGIIVISARYNSSNYAYQGAKLPPGPEQAEYWEWLEHLEYQTLGVVRPDLVIFQYLLQETSEALMQARANQGGEGKDGHEENAAYLTRVIDTYRFLCDQHETWHAVDVSDNSRLGIQKPEVITEKLLEIIKPIL